MAKEKEYIVIGSLFGVMLLVEDSDLFPVKESDIKRIKKELSKNKYFTNVKKRKQKKDKS